MLKVDEVKQDMEVAVKDTKFWLDEYTTSFKEMDKSMSSSKIELHGRMDTLDFMLDRRVSVEEMI